MKVLYWQDMTSIEIRKLTTNTLTHPTLIIFPLAVVEAHGPFMPTGCDAKMARMFAHLVCRSVMNMFPNKKVQIVIYDSLTDLGVVSSTYELDGSILHPGELTTHLWFVTIRDMYAKGLRHFFFINGDGGTGKSFRALLFRSKSKWTQFFGSWKGTLDFVSWFEGLGVHVEHAGVHEHAFLKYVCDLADPYTCRLASKLRMSAYRLTDDNLHSLEEFQPKKYPSPPGEIVSWKQIPGQEESAGVSSFSLDEYHRILDSGEIGHLWEQRLEEISNYMAERILHM
ncbi:MAG: hypothetical protein G01um101470_997 [Parcubacteria group bacterium Gr01-1014_70]|nr:MAG: hypothetical protein G01um101470_997 [Parcubacteria group bacterium Gr01-1014_70]